MTRLVIDKLSIDNTNTSNWTLYFNPFYVLYGLPFDPFKTRLNETQYLLFFPKDKITSILNSAHWHHTKGKPIYII